MDEEPNVTPVADVSLPAPSLPADTGKIGAREAGSIITQWRQKQLAAASEPEKPEQPRVNGKFAAAQPESTPSGEDAAPQTEATGETEGADPAETPPLELPRSWSKDKAEHWSKLDRDTQEYLLEHDKTASAEVRRAQNETTEKSKALSAKEQAADQARQQYETATQNALQVLQAQTASEFADIKTDQDVRTLAEQDPFRFVKWQAHQQQIGRLNEQVQFNERARQDDQKKAFETWSQEQDDAFTKQFPEFADKEKSQKARDVVRAYLTDDVGIPGQGLAELWNHPLFRDAKTQRIMYDAARFRAAQQAAKQAIQAPKPAVQRPGTSQKGQQFQDQIAAAKERLSNAKGLASLEAAADLMAARRKAAARR